jgi:hypothetical protein
LLATVTEDYLVQIDIDHLRRATLEHGLRSIRLDVSAYLRSISGLELELDISVT